MPERRIIGRTEWIELIGLDLGELSAKVDTGAYRSSLHCRKVEEVVVDGRKVLRVRFQIGRKRPTREFKKYTRTVVRSSNGSTEDRYVIQTRIRLGNKRYKASFTLSDRSEMKHPVLLGRKFISGKFLVDVSKNHLLTS